MSAKKTPNIFQRLAAVMEECTYVQKDQKRINNQYTAVRHDDVTAKVRPALLKHGICPVTHVLSCEVEHFEVIRRGNPVLNYRAEAQVELRLHNIDDPLDYITICSFGSGDDPGDKAVGKAISYAAKYAMLKALMLETGDDADHDASVESSIPQQFASPAPAQQPAVSSPPPTPAGVPAQTASVEQTIQKIEQAAQALYVDAAAQRLQQLASGISQGRTANYRELNPAELDVMLGGINHRLSQGGPAA